MFSVVSIKEVINYFLSCKMLAVLLAQQIFCAFSVVCLCIKLPWNPALKVTREICSIAGFYCFISHSTFRLLLLLVISRYYFYNAQAI